ncbi:MAG: hypothetical protein GF355_05230 [Candidatus Eisenbacteria bacterium]|nr:hypothetical protein [Candidatus Eisenbacteria bacterium]
MSCSSKWMMIVALAALWGMNAGCSTNTRDIDEVEDVSQRTGQVQATNEQGQPTDAGDAYHVHAAGLTLHIPEGWAKEKPESAMRAAQIHLPSPREDVAAGQITIFHFGPGGGGGIQPNLQRWARQFAQPDGADPMAVATLDEMKVNGLTVHTIEVAGRYQASSMVSGGTEYDEPDWKLLGAIVEGSGGPWFIKGVGPQEVMTFHRDDFYEFLRSARI